VFASDAKAYGRWRRSLDRDTGRLKPLSDAALEAAIMNVARMFPSNVVRGNA
jgi:hypothetical protein